MEPFTQDQQKFLVAVIHLTAETIMRKMHREDKSPVLTKKAAAEYLGVHLNTIDTYIKEGHLAKKEKAGKVYITRKSIDNFLK